MGQAVVRRIWTRGSEDLFGIHGAGEKSRKLYGLLVFSRLKNALLVRISFCQANAGTKAEAKKCLVNSDFQLQFSSCNLFVFPYVVVFFYMFSLFSLLYLLVGSMESRKQVGGGARYEMQPATEPFEDRRRVN